MISDIILKEKGCTEEKKRKIDEVYSDGKWKDEDEYEILKLRKVILIFLNI